ncbi:MAG: DNA replication/repair protein RecF [Bacilli bacterium]|nr:DNA replication/repair protein RecF [Bacilli bacterium]
MWLEYLKLLNFRNYEKLDVKFHPTLNLIYGKNGEGKTNLVESIYVLGLTRSFRLVNDRTLIHHNYELAKIEGSVHNRYETNYKIILSKDGKKVQINNNKVLKLSDYVSKINIILFHPNDLKIIKDTPSIRRKNLNIDISQLNLNYLKDLNAYNKVLKQRNAYLKQLLLNGNNSSSYLDILTQKMVEYGLRIHKERVKFIEFLNSYVSKIYFEIAKKGNLKIEYVSDYCNLDEEDLQKMYEKSLKKDLSFGKTNLGIHTDDLIFQLDGRDLKDYGSEGQQKNAIISMKFAELELFKKQKGYYPILILDDLFSELDEDKIQNILNFITKEIQVFITTTNVNHLGCVDNKCYRSFHIENGQIMEVVEHE